MKRTKLLLIGFLMAIPILGFAVTANAQSFRSGNNITVPGNETLNSTLYTSGRNVDIAGTVNGDIFCAAQTVTISGEVNGDVLCAAQTIHISGTVDGSVRLAAQNITINGTIERNATLMAQSVTTDTRSSFGGDVGITSTDAILNGNIDRDLAVAAGTVTINGQVGRNITGTVDTLRLGDAADVQGNIEYTSQNTLQRDGGAQVNGNITRNEPEQGKTADASDALPLFALYLFLAMLLASIVLVLLFPRVFQTAANTALASLGTTLLIGLATSIIVPVIIMILMFTVIGIPLAILALLAWLVVILLSGPFAAYLLGRFMWGKGATNAIWVMLFGSIVLLLLYFVPILNILVMLLALWFGVGMIVRSLRFQMPSYALAPVDASGQSTTSASTETALRSAAQTKTQSARKTTSRSRTTRRK